MDIDTPAAVLRRAAFRVEGPMQPSRRVSR